MTDFDATKQEINANDAAMLALSNPDRG